VALPTLRLRGLLWVAEPILIARGRAVEHCKEVFLGIDVAKARNAIAVTGGERGGEVRFVGEVDASEESMRRVVKRIATTCEREHFYEAGPTVYGLHRLITSLGHSCIVVAPSLSRGSPAIGLRPTGAPTVGLAKLPRAGELTAVWVPDEGHEAMRDLVRVRAAAVESQRAHRQQVIGFMLKHGRIFPRTKASGPANRAAGDGRGGPGVEGASATT
jgi:transposase